MQVLGASRSAVNASTASKFERYYSAAPIRVGEKAALLRWASCYVSDERLERECGQALLADAARRCIALRRDSCREAAEQFAEIAAEHDVWFVRFCVLLQADDAEMGRWIARLPDGDLRAIWRAPRDRLAPGARKPLTLAQYRDQGLARFRQRKSLGEFRTAALRKFRRKP